MIIEGDCAEVLISLEESSVDLVLTSPPYDNLRGYDSLPLEKFEIVAKELKRILKPGGVIVWIVADSTVDGSESGTSFKQALYFKEVGLKLHDTMIWKKTGSPFQHPNRYISSFEYMFILSSGSPKTVNLIEDRRNVKAGLPITGLDRQADNSLSVRSGTKVGRLIKDFGARYNVWEIFQEQRRNEAFNEHPAVFPEPLIKDHMRTWSNPGDLVLDPFLGSGTTGKCAHELGREFIGIEIDPKYVKLATDRIDECKSQIAMFYE